MSQVNKRLPIVQLLTSGGTIAGAAQSAVSVNYQSAAKSGEELLAAVSGLEQFAALRVTNVVAKDSADLLLEDWQKIYAATCQAIADPEVTAVVVMHGTDTLEETAYFLDALLRTDKPIVLVGAMRPATALSADGPLNLLNAVAVAVNQGSVGRGVLVVMNDCIMTARAVVKSHSTAVQAFTSPELGGLAAGIGRVYWGQVRYSEAVVQVNSTRPVPFAGWGELTSGCDLPRVEILYIHAGMSLPSWLDGASVLPQGLVLAGTGAGNVPSYLKPAIAWYRAQGVIVVRSTRVWAGGVIPDYQGLDAELDLISAGDLNPHKARIMLLLALRFSREVAKVRSCFTGEARLVT